MVASFRVLNRVRHDHADRRCCGDRVDDRVCAGFVVEKGDQRRGVENRRRLSVGHGPGLASPSVPARAAARRSAINSSVYEREVDLRLWYLQDDALAKGTP